MGSTGTVLDLDIVAGLPHSRTVRLVNGSAIWPTAESFEARMHIRAQNDPNSTLKYDFTPHLQKSFDGADILIKWNLTGAQTRVVRSGFYDLVVSDPGTEDSRALRLTYGQVKIEPLLTIGGEV